MDYQKYYEARDILEDFFRKDLLGPVKDDEIIKDTWPTDYYIAGRLYPRDIELNQEEVGENSRDDEQEGNEQPINMCYSAYPSSMAVSFTVKPGVEKLKAKASFAWYVPVEQETKTTRKRKPVNWHRKFRVIEDICIDTGKEYQSQDLHEGLELKVYLQKEYLDGSRTMTVAMVNTKIKQMEFIMNNSLTFFQPEIRVFGKENGEGVFIEKKLRVKLGWDRELLNLEMLYLHNKTFAMGHGCSVDWKSKGDSAHEICSDFIPKHELFQMKPATHVESKVLSFQFLNNGTQSEVSGALEEIVKSYRKWIDQNRVEISRLPERYHEVAQTNLDLCYQAMERIKQGIELLADDKWSFKTFQLVNAAMLRMRLQQQPTSKREEHTWYPFQLAFILQEIPSIANPHNEYRDTVDLLWFPTGGGKTEAYLGLAAFTIFLRRIRAVKDNRLGGGLTVIMRYTLRLLTLQQFERAAALICACDLIRQEDQSLLGNEEISAGLWVGGGLTPNWRKGAVKALDTIRTHGIDSLSEDEANPCQIHTCPWCGSNIIEQNYTITEEKMIISCPNEYCEFNRGLPIYLIDEDIYDYKPSLVVATVDKFARMTWEKKVGKLFALNIDLLPPELIIQDELHLISGPLGTVSGLYEVAIDEFCKNNGVSPKVISSTATIRNARSQILNLYGRDFKQFPPQGIDIRDSYFAEEAPKTNMPNRNYLGVLAPGTSGNTLLIRVYSILLFTTRYLTQKGFPKEVIDSFWTLTGYFNSLKQLGGAVNNVIDDVHGRLKYLYETKFRGTFPKGSGPSEYPEIDELTSRKANSEISRILKRLQKKYPDREAFDVILASNMLSVGIDIGRLGLMVLQGQPKSNAEYIQATSRVGRQTPGLVVTMHDASRSRDRSHYEQFRSFHASLYRYVEATSLTPFAERARDRALHAVLISLSRHLIKDLTDNRDAGNITRLRSSVEEQIEKILEKVKIIDNSEVESTRDQLYSILDKWEQKGLLMGSELVYQRYYKQQGVPLLTDKFNSEGDATPTLNSMRNVDEECDVLLLGG